MVSPPALTAALAMWAVVAPAMGVRPKCVGFAQVLLLEPPPPPDALVFLRVRNPDGSEAEACGNGTRCVAARTMDELGSNRLNVETVAGVLEATRGADGLVTVDMGPANLEWCDIPLAKPCDTLHLDIANGPLVDPVAVNIGNPHMVFFVDDADTIDLGALGPKLEHHPLYPERTNVEVVSVLGPDKVRMRVWERSAGITQACGSGARAGTVPASPRAIRRATARARG